MKARRDDKRRLKAGDFGADDAVLRFLRDRVSAVYGDRVDEVVLFGSRARGEATVDSDYDIAVFLRFLTDPRVEDDRLADIGWELLRTLGAVVSFKAFEAADREKQTLLMENIRNEGVQL